MSRRARAIGSLLFAAALSCARPPQQPVFRPVVAPDPAAAWSELVRLRQSFAGAESYARVRVIAGERRQSFTARVALDRSGRVLIEALTPLGTGAISIWTDGQHVVYLDHLQNIFWTGAPRELEGALRGLATGTPLLLIGLPASSANDGSVRYRTEATGLAEAVVADLGVRVTYVPPAFPPSRVNIEVGSGERVEIDHLEITEGSAELVRPEVPAGYRQGTTPRLVPPR